MSGDARHALGKDGENAACEELRRRGYEILETRYRTRYGEIDIIARDRAVTVFVEVKTRTGADFGEGADAVTAWKQRRVTKIALDYASRHGLHDTPCRFDVVAVDASSSGERRVEVYTNAFDAML